MLQKLWGLLNKSTRWWQWSKLEVSRNDQWICRTWLEACENCNCRIWQLLQPVYSFAGNPRQNSFWNVLDKLQSIHFFKDLPGPGNFTDPDYCHSTLTVLICSLLWFVLLFSVEPFTCIWRQTSTSTLSLSVSFSEQKNKGRDPQLCRTAMACLDYYFCE